MRKIRIIEHISLDGVIQAPGGPNEDGNYPYDGWAAPHADPAGGEAIVAAHGEAFDLLLGRRTYDIFSGSWPKAEKSPMGDGLNAATKYVATHRPDSLGWGPAEALGPDIVDGVRRIKAKGGPHLIVWGSSTLTPLLLEYELADEILLLVFPVLLGTGKRSFRMEPRHANSRSLARRRCPQASSSAPTSPTGLCGPALSTMGRREPTSEIMGGSRN
jgi:dihydrofolate reductase